jgi:hypothetical protein
MLSDKYEYFFNNILYTLLFEKILKKGTVHKKTAIIFGTNNAVDRFYDDIEKSIRDNNMDYTVGKFNGNMSKAKISSLQSDIILTTDKSFSKAIDVSDLECLINFVPLSSPTKNEQMIGRLRKLNDKKVFYMDIIDTGFESCKKQLQIKKTVFNKKAEKIYELVL